MKIPELIKAMTKVLYSKSGPMPNIILLSPAYYEYYIEYLEEKYGYNFNKFKGVDVSPCETLLGCEIVVGYKSDLEVKDENITSGN